MYRFFGILALLALASCGVIGPTAVVQTRTPYNEVINETSTQQLLLNLVRVKQAEIPTFVDLAETDSTNSATFGLSGGSANLGAPTILSAITGNATAVNSELFRLIPVQGFALIQQVSTPISPDAIVKLYNSDFNLLPTLHFAVDRLTPGYSDYFRAQDLLLLLNEYGAIVLSAEGNSAVAKDEKATFGNRQASSDQNLIISFRRKAVLASEATSGVEVDAEKCPTRPTNAYLSVDRLWNRLESIYGKKGSSIVLNGSSNTSSPFFFSTRSAFGTLKLGENDGVDFDFETPEEAREIRNLNRNQVCKVGYFYFKPDRDLSLPPLDQVTTMWEALYQDAFGVGSDIEHLRGRTRKRDNKRVFIIIERSELPPVHAYVSIFRKGLWYAISDDDNVSKLNFQLLNQIVTIQSIPVQSQPLTPSIALK